MKKLIFLLLLSSNICSNQLYSMSFGKSMPQGAVVAGASYYKFLYNIHTGKTDEKFNQVYDNYQDFPVAVSIKICEKLFDSSSDFNSLNNEEGQKLKLQLACDIVFKINNGAITLDQIPHTAKYLVKHLVKQFESLKKDLLNTELKDTSMLFCKIKDIHSNDAMKKIIREAILKFIKTRPKQFISKKVFEDFLNTQKILLDNDCLLLKDILKNEEVIGVDNTPTIIQEYFIDNHGLSVNQIYMLSMVLSVGLFTYCFAGLSYLNHLESIEPVFLKNMSFHLNKEILILKKDLFSSLLCTVLSSYIYLKEPAQNQDVLRFDFNRMKWLSTILFIDIFNIVNR